MTKSLMDKINQGRQYRSMTMEVRSASENTESKIVEGYATTFNEPYCLCENDSLRYLEQVSERAFENCDMGDVVFQYDHEGRVYARLSNGTLKLSVDDHGLKVEADLGGTEEGRKLYEEIKGGYTTKMSFGFMIGETEEKRTKASDGKTEYLVTITRITKLYDVSAVSIPANDGTEISSRSYFNGLIEAEKKEAERLLEEQRKLTIEMEARKRRLTLLQLENLK